MRKGIHHALQIMTAFCSKFLRFPQALLKVERIQKRILRYFGATVNNKMMCYQKVLHGHIGSLACLTASIKTECM